MMRVAEMMLVIDVTTTPAAQAAAQTPVRLMPRPESAPTVTLPAKVAKP